MQDSQLQNSIETEYDYEKLLVGVGIVAYVLGTMAMFATGQTVFQTGLSLTLSVDKYAMGMSGFAMGFLSCAVYSYLMCESE